MAFTTNDYQQYRMTDSFNYLRERTQKFVENSWAKGFAEIIFPAINEERFSVLYSNNQATRPNSPVNVTVGALILKEMLSLTDDELLASMVCDVRFQYALHTTSFDEQPVSDRTFSRFRQRLYDYAISTGVDLVKEEMESMAEAFVDFAKLNRTMRRMDSAMISSNCRKMSRLEIIYTCVANMVKAMHRTGEEELLAGLLHYLDEDDKNNTIYRTKEEETSRFLNQVICDAAKLLCESGDALFELPEYQLLKRVFAEQARIDEDGNYLPKDKKEIAPDSLQNASDSDATYRRKAGKDHKGYVGNLEETFDEKGSIITAYDYQPNNYSDSKFCKDTIGRMGKQEESVTLIADGAYGGSENVAIAMENNINLVTTALLGKDPNKAQAGFEINETTHTITKCPGGYAAVKNCYYPKTGMYRCTFDKAICKHCLYKNECGIKFQKKSSVVLITVKTVDRAKYLKKLSTEEYRLLGRMRNGVEGLMSILRRKYNVDHMPVRGLVRSKIWFGFKIGAINAKKVMAMA